VSRPLSVDALRDLTDVRCSMKNVPFERAIVEGLSDPSSVSYAFYARGMGRPHGEPSLTATLWKATVLQSAIERR